MPPSKFTIPPILSFEIEVHPDALGKDGSSTGPLLICFLLSDTMLLAPTIGHCVVQAAFKMFFAVFVGRSIYTYGNKHVTFV